MPPHRASVRYKCENGHTGSSPSGYQYGLGLSFSFRRESLLLLNKTWIPKVWVGKIGEGVYLGSGSAILRRSHDTTWCGQHSASKSQALFVSTHLVMGLLKFFPWQRLSGFQFPLTLGLAVSPALAHRMGWSWNFWGQYLRHFVFRSAVLLLWHSRRKADLLTLGDDSHVRQSHLSTPAYFRTACPTDPASITQIPDVSHRNKGPVASCWPIWLVITHQNYLVHQDPSLYHSFIPLHPSASQPEFHFIFWR